MPGSPPPRAAAPAALFAPPALLALLALLALTPAPAAAAGPDAADCPLVDLLAAAGPAFVGASGDAAHAQAVGGHTFLAGFEAAVDAFVVGFGLGRGDEVPGGLTPAHGALDTADAAALGAFGAAEAQAVGLSAALPPGCPF